MKCARCLAPCDAGDLFCRQCGFALKRVCPSCGQAANAGTYYCASCGAEIASGAPRTAARVPGAALSSERKFLTVMFADVVGSTQLGGDLDPEGFVATLSPVVGLMFKAVHAYGGTVNRVQGDGIMALFGAPTAHEDHAVRACLASLALLDEVNALGDAKIQVRVGLNSGLVVLHAINNDISLAYEAGGSAVHLAARMEQLCQPGTVRMSRATYQLAASAITATSLGVVPVKGFAVPVESFQVTGRSANTGAVAKPGLHVRNAFVGRGKEIDAVDRAIELCKAGRGHCVLITGPPGIGKSRLIIECMQRLHAPEWRLLRAECASYHQHTTYQALKPLLRSLYAEAATSMLDSEIDAAPLSSLLDMPVDAEQWLALDPSSRQRRIVEAVSNLIVSMARTQPIALVIEDLHWADLETVRIIQRIIVRTRSERCLVIVSAREANPAIAATDPQLIRLDSLQDHEASRLLDDLLGIDRSTVQLKRRIMELSQGIPLFIEEIVRSLAESGDITAGPDGYRLQRRVNALRIPATLTALLSSRIDRIDPALKWALQVASVIGSVVSGRTLARVLDQSEQAAGRQLRQLQSFEFLRTDLGGTTDSFAFQHALVRDAAYESLLQSQRVALHAAVLGVLEAAAHAGPDEQVERLAQHAMFGELWAKALSYSKLAAEKAFRRSAMHDASQLVEQALYCAARLPQDEPTLATTVDLHVLLRIALWPLGAVEEANSHLDKAEALADRLGDDERLTRITISRTQILLSEGNLDEAVATGLRAEARARTVGDGALVIGSHLVLAQAFLFRGDFRKSIDILEAMQPELLVGRRHERLLGNATTTSLQNLVFASRAYCLLGRFATAHDLAREACDIADAVQRPFDMGFAWQALGSVALFNGDLGAACRSLEQALTLCETHSLDSLFPLVAAPLGLAQVRLGRTTEGRRLLDDARSVAQETRLKFYLVWCSALLARGCIEAGVPEAAAELIREGLAVAAAHRYRWLEAWLLHAEGIVAAGNHLAHGLDRLREAAALAAELGMLPDVALCHWSMAQLYARKGDTDAATRHRAAASAIRGDIGLDPAAMCESAAAVSPRD